MYENICQSVTHMKLPLENLQQMEHRRYAVRKVD